MNFAPYQEAPEVERALSPPPPGTRPSFESGRVKSPPPRPTNNTRVFPYARSRPPTSSVANNLFNGLPSSSRAAERAQNLQAFETSLPLRLDYEAMMAYLLLPPAGSVLLLLLEHKSDYVRFHAWQGGMLFTCVFVIHLIFSWSKVISWILFAVDLLLIGFLTLHAHRDAENLDYYEVPFFGRLANRFVDDE